MYIIFCVLKFKHNILHLPLLQPCTFQYLTLCNTKMAHDNIPTMLLSHCSNATPSNQTQN